MRKLKRWIALGLMVFMALGGTCGPSLEEIKGGALPRPTATATAVPLEGIGE